MTASTTSAPAAGPSLVGISNDRHEPSRVELRAPFGAEGDVRLVLDGCDGAVWSAREPERVRHVDIPARELALIFEHGAASGTKAG